MLHSNFFESLDFPEAIGERLGKVNAVSIAACTHLGTRRNEPLESSRFTGPRTISDVYGARDLTFHRPSHCWLVARFFDTIGELSG